MTGDRSSARTPHRRRGRGVPLPGRLHRGRLGAPDRGRRTSRDRARTPAGRRPRLRRDPDAGGHPGLRVDGADLGRGRGPQGRRPAVPRLPPPPHHRWRDGLVGVTGPHDRGRAGGAGRLPGAAGLRGALRRDLPRGRADLGEPLRPRPHRRRRRARGHRRHPRPGAGDPAGAGRPGGAGGPAAAGDRRGHVGVDHPVTARGPTRRTAPAEVRRQRRRASQRHRPGRARPRPDAGAGALRGDPVRGAGAGPPRADPAAARSARRHCARPAAGCGWPRSCTCRC